MPNAHKQPSFSRGELDPALHVRTDLEGYRTGAAVVRNMIVMRSGGLQNRAGLKFVAPTKFATTSGSTVRVIPFVFDTDDSNTYCIEVGDLYFRFHKNGEQIRLTAKNITNITQANPAVVTSNAHGYSNGDEVYISGVIGMKQVNGRWFKAAGVTANTFNLTDRDGANINSTGYTAYTSGGTAEKVYEITTTYDEDDVMALSFAQLNDTMIFAHESYPPRKLVRTSDTSWAISNVDFGPPVTSPAIQQSGTNGATAGAAGSNTYRYRVACIGDATGTEGIPDFTAGITITGATNANPVVITAAGHLFQNGDVVIFSSMVGMTELEALPATAERYRYFVVANRTANTFELSGTNGTGFGVFVSGSCLRAGRTIASAAAPTLSAPHTLTWDNPGGTFRGKYAVYREVGGVYGFLGFAAGNTYSDIGGTPDTGDTPWELKLPFGSAGNYPSKVCFYQQRLCFANSTNDPNTIWMSAINDFYNFNDHTPQKDGDSIEFEIVGTRAIQIRSMMDLGRLVVFTTEGEYIINGDESGTVTPFSIDPRQVSGNGSSSLPALLVNSSALYVQARSSQVRDLVKTPVQIDGYDGDERSIWAAHLFRGYTLSDWAYQQVPESIAWMVRSDGDLNAMTYIREQSVFGWSRHDTQGTFESMCTVPEGSQDSLYVVVSRTVNGASQRYIERLESRHIGPDSDDVEDNKFVDSCKTFDGRNTGATTMTITTATNYTAGSTLTLTSSASFFNQNMIDDKINVTSATGTVVHLLITAFTSATVVSVTGDIDIPANLQNTARTTWGRARKTIPELWHLEGMSVSVQGDSFVEASPNNSSLTTRTVSSGSVALGRWYEVLHIGLPYVADFKSLPIDTPDNFQILTGKRKLVKNVLAQVKDSRGIYAGESLPSSDASTTGLTGEMIPLPSGQSFDSTPALTTGNVEIDIKAEWNDTGVVAIRQLDPLPLSLLSIVPQGHLIPNSR